MFHFDNEIVSMLYHKFLLSVLLSIHSLRLVFIINCIKLAIKFEFPISKIHCQLIFLKIISGNDANLDTNESLFDDFIKRAKKKSVPFAQEQRRN